MRPAGSSPQHRRRRPPCRLGGGARGAPRGSPAAMHAGVHGGYTAAMHAGVHNARTSAPGRRGPGPGLDRPYAAFDVVAMVASTGGLRAYSRILSALPADFPAAILVVQQRDPRQPGLLADLLSRRTELRVQPAADGERLRP